MMNKQLKRCLIKGSSNTIQIIFHQRVSVYMDDEDMDNFVFAVALKKNAVKLQKEFQDLVSAKL